MSACKLCDSPTSGTNPTGLCRYCQQVDDEIYQANEDRRQPVR